MQTHPFIGSVINRVMGITLSVVAWMMYSWLLFCYGGEEIWIACLDGLVSVGLLAAAGFLYGYVDGTIHSLIIKVYKGEGEHRDCLHLKNLLSPSVSS